MALKEQKLEAHDEKEPKSTELRAGDLNHDTKDTTEIKKKKKRKKINEVH